MTEDEAKSKFCCAATGGPDLLSLGMCVGSNCMAWRWLRKPPDVPSLLMETDLSVRMKNALWLQGIATVSEALTLSESDVLAIPNLGRRHVREMSEFREALVQRSLQPQIPQGFCGLAGKP